MNWTLRMAYRICMYCPKTTFYTFFKNQRGHYTRSPSKNMLPAILKFSEYNVIPEQPRDCWKRPWCPSLPRRKPSLSAWSSQTCSVASWRRPSERLYDGPDRRRKSAGEFESFHSNFYPETQFGQIVNYRLHKTANYAKKVHQITDCLKMSVISIITDNSIFSIQCWAVKVHFECGTDSSS